MRKTQRGTQRRGANVVQEEEKENMDHSSGEEDASSDIEASDNSTAKKGRAANKNKKTEDKVGDGAVGEQSDDSTFTEGELEEEGDRKISSDDEGGEQEENGGRAEEGDDHEEPPKKRTKKWRFKPASKSKKTATSRSLASVRMTATKRPIHPAELRRSSRPAASVVSIKQEMSYEASGSRKMMATKKQKITAKSSTDSDGGEWEVENILNVRTAGKTKEYFIKWKGFSAKSNTWEPAKNLNCRDLIKKFEDSLKEKKKRTPTKRAVGANSLDSSDDDFYEVEKIVDVRKIKGNREFKVKWKGYPTNQNSWEPESNLDCPKVIKEFEDSLKKEDSDSDLDDDDRGYEVVDIREFRVKNGRRQYRVKWGDTWKDEDELTECAELIKQFEERETRKMAKSLPSTSRSSGVVTGNRSRPQTARRGGRR